MQSNSKQSRDGQRTCIPFDDQWYLEQYPDVTMLGMDPLEHYLWLGEKLGRKPTQNYDAKKLGEHSIHIATNGDDFFARGTNGLKSSGLSAKVRYQSTRRSFDIIERGADCELMEPYFDDQWYNTQFDQCDLPPDSLAHFESIGWRLGLSPNRWFDTLGYVSVHKDVARAGINPFVHYLKHGKSERRSPNPYLVDRRKENHSLKRIWAREYGPVEKILNFYRHNSGDIDLSTSVCVHFHAYFTDMIDDATLALRRITRPFTLLVSVPYYEDSGSWQNYFESQLPNASKIIVKGVENRGRDVAPWLVDFRDEIALHDLFYHFHTKRSNHSSEHRYWFRFLSHAMIGSRHVVDQIIEVFENDPTVGLISPGYWPELKRQPNFGGEEQQFRDLCQRMDIDERFERCPDFPAGSFFWCRTKILKPLFELNLGSKDFPEETGQVAATLAHAVERIMGALPTKSSMRTQFVAIDKSHDMAEHQSADIDAFPEGSARSSLRVSVLIPTWNRRNSVCRAIRSALNQSYRPSEIIVVDDGSEDGTLELLAEMFGSEIRDGLVVIAKSHHKGVSAARNIGLDLCTGDIVTYLDSDNTWRTDYLNQVVATYENFPHALSVYTDFLSHDTDLDQKSHFNRSYDRAYLVNRNFIDLNVFSHKRIFVDEGIRFDTELKRLVDWDLIIRITSRRAPLHVRYIGADYNLDGQALNNITRTVPIEDNLARIQSKHRKERVYWRHEKLKIVVKCPAPNASIADQWGDYHFAQSLCRSFERQGCTTRIDLLCDWESRDNDSDDVVLVLRGLSRYVPKPGRINLMWLMSHPDKVSLEEMKEFDHIFVASNSFARSVHQQLKANVVSPLLQCSDPDLFYHQIGQAHAQENDVVFVGNSRKVDRWMPRVCSELGLPLQVYGADWDGRLPSAVVKGEHIPNEKLGEFYSSSKIVLNDHWPDMAKNGFISNRIFDAALSGALIISDSFQGAEIFFGNVVCCETVNDVERSIKHYLDNDEDRLRKVSSMQEIVRLNHTFDRRAAEILETVKILMSRNPPFDISTTVPVLAADDSVIG